MKNRILKSKGFTRLNFPRKKQGGFTMVELLVTMGIFMMLMGVALAKYRTFGTNAMFVNASEDVVLALRQAQVYGEGTKGVAACAGGAFKCAYGVHFSASIPHGFTSFVDNNSNGIYDVGEEIETITWNNAVSVTGIKCTLSVTDCIGSVMDITFKRPNPDAHIFDLSALPLGFPGYKEGWIILADANTGKTSTIAISLAGQISVQ